MVNKQFEAFKLSIVKAMDFSASKDELEKLKKIILDYNNNPLVDEKNKINKKFLSFDKLYLSQNDKTGPHTINMNISSGFYCYECIKGHCNVQNTLNSKKGKFDKIICYSLANNNRLARTMTYGLINYIVFNTLPIDELVRQIKRAIDATNSYYLRFNEMGSFYSLDSFWKCDKIAKILKEDVISYSYTSNKKLFDKVHKDSFMTLSLSLGFADVDNVKIEDYKQTIVIQDNYETIKPLLDDDRFIFCNEACSNCSQCKNKDNNKITVFIRHGAGHSYHLTDVIGIECFKNKQRHSMFKNMSFVSKSLT